LFHSGAYHAKPFCQIFYSGLSFKDAQAKRWFSSSYARSYGGQASPILIKLTVSAVAFGVGGLHFKRLKKEEDCKRRRIPPFEKNYLKYCVVKYYFLKA
jgi:hypothetical protein